MRILSGIVGLCLLFLFSGLVVNQIFLYPKYKKEEIRQNQRRIIIPGPRGNIYDREGRLLVGNRPRYSAVVFLNELRPEFRKEYFRLLEQGRERNYQLQIDARANVVQNYQDQVAEVLGRKLKVDPGDIERHFRSELLLPFPLISDLSPHEYALLLEQIPVQSKIQIYSSNARYYPYGSLAAHTLGYVGGTDEISTEGLPGEDLMTFSAKGFQGKTGIEKQFDDQLQGEAGLQIWVVDPSGFQHEPLATKPPVQGKDLKITLDAELQDIAELSIGERMGALVALDVKRGDLLVIASKPDYNLNDLSPYIPYAVAQDINDRGAWQNNALQGTFAPGSTFKVVVAMAGLRAGIIDEHSMTHCGGSYRIGTRTFHCWNRLGHGDIDLLSAIEHSCNVFFYQFGQDIGVDRISQEAIRFGFNEQTGIELPFESKQMLVPTREWKKENQGLAWFPGDTANFSIGQGFLRVTPLQMACFTAAFARRETRFKPTIIYDPYRQVSPSKRDIGLSDHDYNLVLHGMEMAGSVGTARLIKGRDSTLRVAGKTGTAQVRMKGGMGHLAWTIAFAPIEDPEIAIAVVIIGESVGDELGGGSTAAPIARPVMERFFEKRRAGVQ